MKNLLKGIVGQVNLPWLLNERNKQNLKESASVKEAAELEEREKKKFQIGRRTRSDKIDTTKKSLSETHNETETEIRLTFEVGRISGQGNDFNGPYYWDGTYKFEKDKAEHVIWSFNLRKKYFGRHTITYAASFRSASGRFIIFEGQADDGFQKWEFTLQRKLSIY
jgi:hypothetical protein